MFFRNVGFPCQSHTASYPRRQRCAKLQRYWFVFLLQNQKSILKNAVFWDVTPRQLLRTDVSEESIASNIRLTRIGKPGTTLVLLRTLRRLLLTLFLLHRFLSTYVPLKRRIL
jgi:hypothetical protein